MFSILMVLYVGAVGEDAHVVELHQVAGSWSSGLVLVLRILFSGEGDNRYFSSFWL